MSAFSASASKDDSVWSADELAKLDELAEAVGPFAREFHDAHPDVAADVFLDPVAQSGEKSILWRYLVAREFDVAAAAAMFRHALAESHA